MILSYNHVPFKQAYKEEHEILDDLSNAYLCYNGNDEAFDNILEGMVNYLPIQMFVDLHYFNQDVGDYIKVLAKSDKLPLIYNQFQIKYEVYVCFDRDEKEQFDDSFLTYLWAQRFVRKEDGTYEYNTYNAPVTEKFWMLNILISNTEINNYNNKQEEDNE